MIKRKQRTYLKTVIALLERRSMIGAAFLSGLLVSAPSFGAQFDLPGPINTIIHSIAAHKALPSRSTTIALSKWGSDLIVVNTDNDSISLFNTGGNELQKLAEIPVGNEPGCIALHPSDKEAYVTNAQSGTVSVVSLHGIKKNKVVDTIAVGAEPGGCALTPSGALLYVANFTAGTVSVINTSSRAVVNTVLLPGNPTPNPAAISVTNDGDGDDNDETVFVTQFYAELKAGGSEGFNEDKQGIVHSFSVSNPSLLTKIPLSPLADSGFTANRTNLCTKLNPAAVNDTFCPDPAATAPNATITNNPQGVFPNQFFSALIRGNRLYLPNIGASPEPPVLNVNFNTNVQALVHVADIVTLTERPDLHVNLNAQIKTEPQPADQRASLGRLFANDIVAIDANSAGTDFLIVSRGGNYVLRASGSSNAPLNIGAPNVVRFQTGNIPNGVVMSPDGRLAYVNNEVGCSVSILNLDSNTVIERDVESCTLPDPGSHEHGVRLGKLVFSTALGVPDNGLVGTPIRNIVPLSFRGKQSDNGWSTCASCHPKGLSDHVTWMFGDGPRAAIPLDALYSKINGAHDTRINNASAVRDSMTDFNNNSRGVQGGCGFASDKFAPSLDTCIEHGIGPFTPAVNGPGTPSNPAIFDHGISQGASEALDFETLWVQTVRTLNQPSGNADQVAAGRELFKDNCASCHGGAKWTKSQILYLNNPALNKAFAAGGTARDPGLSIVANQAVSYQDSKVDTGVLKFLENIGTFNAVNPIEIRQNGAAPLGALGFNVPSLLGANVNAPYFHNGSAQTLEQVFDQHGFGSGTIATSFNAADQGNLLALLKTIDGRTPLFESDGDIFKDPNPVRNLP
ncbi:MAG: beta-propeller fold lactonase family protein [Methylobacter sp.]|nr:beta-propeller fold lactonase family protein [Methylobacter sp.]